MENNLYAHRKINKYISFFKICSTTIKEKSLEFRKPNHHLNKTKNQNVLFSQLSTIRDYFFFQLEKKLYI